MTYTEEIITDIVEYAGPRYLTVFDVLTDLVDRAGMFHNEPDWVKAAEAAIEDGFNFEELLENEIEHYIA
jgi:hypothetical protein